MARRELGEKAGAGFGPLAALACCLQAFSPQHSASHEWLRGWIALRMSAISRWGFTSCDRGSAGRQCA